MDKKKRFIIDFTIVLVIGCMCLLCVFNIGRIARGASTVFWRLIALELDREDEERRRLIADGKIVRGKDTVLIWGDTFDICRYPDGESLGVQTSDGYKIVLEKITYHEVVRNWFPYNKKLYVLSEEGFAVIDEDNVAKVYIVVPPSEFVSGYSEDENGKRDYFLRYIEDERIRYLSDFDDFSEEEQQKFEKLME